MALENSIHGYYDKRLAEIDSTAIYSINLAGNKDYVARTLPGTIIIFFLIIIAGLISNITVDKPSFYYSMIFFSFINIVVHFYLFRTINNQSPSTIRQWEIYFSMTALSTGIIWSVFNSWSMIHNGIGDITLVFLLFTVGIASGAVASNFIWKRVAQLFLAIVLVPPIFILIIFQDGLIISAAVIFYFLFLYLQLIRSNSEYWKALINNKQLESQTEELKKVSRAKSEFLSSMSHELRTPLNAILGFGELLRDRSKNGDISNELIQRYADYILKGGDQLLGLINEVLDLSRIEGGYIKVELEPVQLKNIIP